MRDGEHLKGGTWNEDGSWLVPVCCFPAKSSYDFTNLEIIGLMLYHYQLALKLFIGIL